MALHQAFTFESNEAIQSAMEGLQEFNLNTQENYSLLTKAKHAWCIAEALIDLHKLGLDTKENITLIMQYPDRADVSAKGIIYLVKAGMYTQKNKDLLQQQADNIWPIAIGLTVLHKILLDTEENIAILTQHAKHSYYIDEALSYIGKKLTTQDNFNTLIHYRELIPVMLPYFKDINLDQAKFNERIKKTHAYNIKNKMPFFEGDHPRLGEKSALKTFFWNTLSDPKNLSKEIFDFLPTVGRGRISPQWFTTRSRVQAAGNGYLERKVRMESEIAQDDTFKDLL